MTDTNNTQAHNTIEATASGSLSVQIGRTGEKAKFQGRMVTLDLGSLPAEAVRFALVYGLKQYIADGTAGSEDQTGYDVGIDQRLTKLASGDFTRVTGERGPRVETAEGLALRNAIAAINAKVKAAGQSADKAKVREAAAKMVEAQPKWLADAKKALAEQAKLAEGLDLGDFMNELLGLTEGEA